MMNKQGKEESEYKVGIPEEEPATPLILRLLVRLLDEYVFVAAFMLIWIVNSIREAETIYSFNLGERVVDISLPIMAKPAALTLAGAVIATFLWSHIMPVIDKLRSKIRFGK